MTCIRLCSSAFGSEPDPYWSIPCRAAPPHTCTVPSDVPIRYALYLIPGCDKFHTIGARYGFAFRHSSTCGSVHFGILWTTSGGTCSLPWHSSRLPLQKNVQACRFQKCKLISANQGSPQARCEFVASSPQAHRELVASSPWVCRELAWFQKMQIR